MTVSPGIRGMLLWSVDFGSVPNWTVMAFGSSGLRTVSAGDVVHLRPDEETSAFRAPGST